MISTLTLTLLALSSVAVTAQLTDLVSTLVADGRFTTLVAAVQAAGLVSTIQTTTLTILAPTDSAFSALPAGVVAGLLANTTTLSDVLLYHALPGSLSSRQVLKLKSAQTVEGANVQITLAGANAFINQAKIVQANIAATNGYIHVLDSVLVGRTSIVSQAVANGQLSTLVTALRAANLVNALAAMPSVTVFAPTNTAFNNLPAGALQGLLNNVTALQQVLLYHVLPTAQYANQLVTKKFSRTAQGDVVFVDSDVNGDFFVNGGAIADPDQFASTGVIHVIDNVLIPY